MDENMLATLENLRTELALKQEEEKYLISEKETLEA